MYKKQLLLKLLCCPLLLLMLSISALAQQTSVTGKVTDEKGGPIPGVSIIVKGTTKGVNSGVNGNYSINVNSNNVLVFTSVGFERQEIAVKGQRVIDIVMQERQQELNDVVVIGYG